MEISRLVVDLVVSKVCYDRLYSNSSYKKREPFTALGSHQTGLNLCVRNTPLQEQDWERGAHSILNYLYPTITQTLGEVLMSS